MTRTAFDLYHPGVACGYFAVLFVLSMAAMQPVYLGITFAAAFAYSAVLRGVRATGRSLVWQLPLVLIIALANPLFSASGSTELFRIGLRAIYLESFVFGACMGLMLTSILLIFSNASRVLTSDKVMALFGNVAPVIGLMLSMAARLVPQFVRRGKDIGGVQRACTAACQEKSSGAKRSDRGAIRSNLRLTSVLMGWSMEDSLETADAMKARGWGVGARRTTYQRYRFRKSDALVLVLVGILALASAIAAWSACSQFTFYPTIAGFAPWWSYLPYVLFALFPLLLEVKERFRWKA